MKTFKLYIDLENDAFQPEASREIACILRLIAEKINNRTDEDLSKYKTIFDINGNDVGRYAIKELPEK